MSYCYVRNCSGLSIQVISVGESKFGFCDGHLDAANKLVYEYDREARHLRDRTRELRDVVIAQMRDIKTAP